MDSMIGEWFDVAAILSLSSFVRRQILRLAIESARSDPSSRTPTLEATRV
jgi:hypothetical protein